MSDARKADKSHLDSGVTVDKSEYTPSTIASCLPHSSIAISISAAVFPTEVMEIQLDSIIPLLLRAIIRKMQMRSQAVLSLTSHFGEDAIAAHGSQLFFVESSRLRKMVHNWRKIEAFGTEIPTCYRHSEPEKEEDPQSDDQLVVIAGKDVTQMCKEEKCRLWLLMDSDNVKIIIRRPRKTDYQILDIEYDMPPAAEEEKHYRFNSSLIGTVPIFDSYGMFEYCVFARRVRNVLDNEPAAKAGIRNGDIVLKINGEHFEPRNMKNDRMEELLKLMYSQPRVRLTVLRMRMGY